MNSSPSDSRPHKTFSTAPIHSSGNSVGLSVAPYRRGVKTEALERFAKHLFQPVWIIPRLASKDRYGLEVPGLGRVTGYAEAYKDLLTGKVDRIGRSNGFFVYVFGRLVNVADGHFGIPPDELRHGTFGRFRLVIHIDALDEELRSNREAISEGPLLDTARNLLRGIFESRLAASRATCSRTPS